MNKEIIKDEEIKKIIKFYYDSCDNFDYEREYTRKLEVYINQLKKKAKLGEHYKHLYSEVKKQKDDVVEYVNFLVIFNQNINGKFSDTLWGQEILELLGEEDDN